MSSVINKKYILPKLLLENLKLAGAKVEESEKGLYLITDINYKDKAWDLYEDLVKNKENNLLTGAGVFPTSKFINSSIVPPTSLWIPIQVEANSLISRYSTLSLSLFTDDNCPIISSPLIAPNMVTNVRHASISVTKMMQGIQNPPITYHNINKLKSGSYICTINQQWENAAILINVFKP